MVALNIWCRSIICSQKGPIIFGTTHILAWFDMSGYLKRSIGSDICKCSSMHVSGSDDSRFRRWGDAARNAPQHHILRYRHCKLLPVVAYQTCQLQQRCTTQRGLKPCMWFARLWGSRMSLSSKKSAAQAEVRLGCFFLNAVSELLRWGWKEQLAVQRDMDKEAVDLPS